MEPIEVLLNDPIVAGEPRPTPTTLTFDTFQGIHDRFFPQQVPAALPVHVTVGGIVDDLSTTHFHDSKEAMDPILELLSGVADKVTDKERDQIENLKRDAATLRSRIENSRTHIASFYNSLVDHTNELQDRLYSYERVKQDLKQLQAEYVCPLDKTPLEYAKLMNEAILSFYRGLGINRDDVSITLNGRYLRYSAGKTVHVRFSRGNAIFIPLIVKIRYITGNNALEIEINPTSGYLHPHINSDVCWGDINSMKDFCMRIENIVNMDIETAKDAMLDFGASLNTMLGFFNSDSPYFTYTDIMSYKMLSGISKDNDADVDNMQEFKKFITVMIESGELQEIMPSDFLSTILEDEDMTEYMDLSSEKYYECDCDQIYGDYEDEHADDCASHNTRDNDTGNYNEVACKRIIKNYETAFGTNNNETVSEAANEDTLF